MRCFSSWRWYSEIGRHCCPFHHHWPSGEIFGRFSSRTSCTCPPPVDGPFPSSLAAERHLERYQRRRAAGPNIQNRFPRGPQLLSKQEACIERFGPCVALDSAKQSNVQPLHALSRSSVRIGTRSEQCQRIDGVVANRVCNGCCFVEVVLADQFRIPFVSGPRSSHTISLKLQVLTPPRSVRVVASLPVRHDVSLHGPEDIRDVLDVVTELVCNYLCFCELAITRDGSAADAKDAL